MDNNKLKNQKGVSLIIVFFVMLILIAIIVSASTLLFSEIKIVKNMGSSVISFYAADSGIEKVLYYDRREVPDGAVRGICNICNPLNSGEWDNCTATGASCTDCTDCHIDFTTTVNPKKFYNVVTDVSLTTGATCGLSVGDVKSYGNNENIKRAINLNMTRAVGSELGPDITDKSVSFTGGEMHITATISECKRDMESITAYITNNQNSDVVTVILGGGNNGNCISVYTGTWGGGIGGVTYYVSIAAIKSGGSCTSVIVNPIIAP